MPNVEVVRKAADRPEVR